MKIVIDSNIIFSAIISPWGKTAELIFLKDFEFFSARTLEKELLEHKNELLKKSTLSENEFELLREILLNKITFFEEEDLHDYILKAKEICPDKDDVAFFAVCLLKNLPLWSNDKKLKNQTVVQVISIEELVKMV